MNCLFVHCGDRDGRPIVCCLRASCGNRLFSDAPGECYAECRAARGLGDRLADWLALHRITKPRVTRWLVRWGLIEPGADCGCPRRQEAVNALGRRVAAARRWFGRISGVILPPWRRLLLRLLKARRRVVIPFGIRPLPGRRPEDR